MPYRGNFWHKDSHENIPSPTSFIFFVKNESWESAYQIWRGAASDWNMARRQAIDWAIAEWRVCLMHVSKPDESILNTSYDLLFHNCQ